MTLPSKFTGAVMAALGFICIIYPIAASAVINIVIGVTFLAAAIFTLFGLPKGGEFWDRLLYIVIAFFFAFVGASMLSHPYIGLLALTVVLGVEFLLQGFYMLFHWSKIRRRYSPASVWILNALVLIILGVVLLSNLQNSLWFIGLLAGVNLFFTGVTILLQKPKY